MQTAYITYTYLSTRRGLCTVQRGSVNNADRKCGTTKRAAAAAAVAAAARAGARRTSRSAGIARSSRHPPTALTTRERFPRYTAGRS